MLKIAAVTLYKHGLGFFERSGTADKDFTLDFPRRAMDDVLKSLTVLPAGGATVRGVAFETPDDRNEDAQRRPITFQDATPLSGLIAAFAGYAVRVQAGERTIEGELIGLERENEQHLKRATLAIATVRGVALIALSHVTGLELIDARAQSDLRFALEQRRRDDERASARVSLSGPSEVAVSYIAPAPAWRVSYRVLIEPGDGETRDVVVQGWGLFDNTLEEDLDGVRLTLTAGMPVSFRYELHQPNTPDRPVVRDEERTVGAPLEYAAASRAIHDGVASNDFMLQEAVAVGAPASLKMARMSARAIKTDALMDSAPAQASGQARGALFAYTIAAPVSVRRGESGMVPIVGTKTKGQRELIYNRTKHPDHPAVSVRFKADAATLERGPAIVLDGGHYGGEAVVPFTSGGAEIILAFALELGITVRHEQARRTETVRLRFLDRAVFFDMIEYTTTTYEAVSTLADPSTLGVEHPRGHDTTFDTAPVEQTLEAGRFRFPVAARATAKFAVVEKRVLERSQDVTGLKAQAIQRYLADKLLTPETVKALNGILAKEAEVEALVTDQKSLDAERKSVRARLDDARKSIAPLTADTDRTLRARFVAQLDAHETALDGLDQREKQILTRIAVLKEQINTEALALGQRTQR